MSKTHTQYVIENLGKDAYTFRFRDHSLCGDAIPDMFVAVESITIWSKTQEQAKTIFAEEYPRCSIESIFKDINMTNNQREREQYNVALPEKPITSLPVWAQRYISELVHKKDSAVEELNILRQRFEAGGYPEAKFFEDGVIIEDSTSSTGYRCVLNSHRVALNDPQTGLKVELLADGTKIRIYADKGHEHDCIAITPSAGNAFNVIGVPK
jgi:hypothetical protein